MIHPDRVLHLLTTRRPADAGDLREFPGWPPGQPRTTFQPFFRHPADALEHLELGYQLGDGARYLLGTRDSDEELERAAGVYTMGLRALALEPAAMVPRAPLYQRLAELLQAHLVQSPALIRRARVGEAVDELVRRLQETGDVELAAEGVALAELAAAARAEPGGPPPGPTSRARGVPVTTYDEVFFDEDDLDPDRAYHLLVEAALADGFVDTYEWASLRGLGHELGIPPARREAIQAAAEAEAEPGPETGAPLDLVVYLGTLRAEAARDGLVSAAEDRLLDRVAHFLCVPREEEAA